MTNPVLIEPHELKTRLNEVNLQVVDLCKAEQYARGHIPGAVHLDYSRLVMSRPPVTGLLPGREYLRELFSTLGLKRDACIVAYDDEGGGHAARLLWTFAACGHADYALLNGGLHAWANEGFPLDDVLVAPERSDYSVDFNPDVVAERDHILKRLDDPSVRVLDCRSPREFSGEDKRAARAGHIPGAVNMDWTDTMDQARNLRLKPCEVLLRRLASVDITPAHEVTVYCQSHHRSAHTWLVLKHLGFTHVRGYPGSWSEWGNLADTPVETGLGNST